MYTTTSKNSKSNRKKKKKHETNVVARDENKLLPFDCQPRVIKCIMTWSSLLFFDFMSTSWSNLGGQLMKGWVSLIVHKRWIHAKHKISHKFSTMDTPGTLALNELFTFIQFSRSVAVQQLRHWAINYFTNYTALSCLPLYTSLSDE